MMLFNPPLSPAQPIVPQSSSSPAMVIQRFAPGAIIFKEGEESDKAYIIRSGQVEIFKRIDKGTLLLANLGPGEIFGEMGVISEQPRTAYASAVMETEVHVLTRDSFGSIVARQPPEVVLMVRALMERLRETNTKVAKLMNKQAQFQLATPNAVPTVNRVILGALTGFLKAQMPSEGVVIKSLPFRVGALGPGEQPNPLDWNNLFIENADHSMISRNHFAIQRSEQGVMISDRGSKMGTIVNDHKIGGATGEFQAVLNPGDNVVIAGTEDSPYRFCITWE